MTMPHDTHARKLAALLWLARATAFLAVPALAHDPQPAPTPDAAAPHVHAAAPVPTSPLVLSIPGKPTQVFDAATLATLPRATVRAGAHGEAAVDWSGVRLVDVLRRAGAPLGEALRGKAMGLVVRVMASDGYVVVFSLAQLDAAFGETQVLVADAKAGQPLGDDGPLRLVVAGDARAARWVRRIERIEVVDASGR